MKLYVVRTTDGEDLAIFSARDSAEREREYLANLDEDSLDFVPLDETKIVEHELNLSFSGAYRGGAV